MNKNKIEWVFFDIGCTLVDEEKCFLKRCHLQAQTEEAIRQNLDEYTLYNEIISASKNYDQQYKAVVKKYHLNTIYPHDTDLEEIYFDTIECLEKLSKKYKLGIVANQEKGLIARMDKMGILKYFQVVVGSHDVGHHKPELEIFNIALKQAHVEPEKCVMVGDRLDNDIYPAKKLKMKTIWILRGFGKYQYPKNIDYVPDATIENLVHLDKVISKLK